MRLVAEGLASRGRPAEAAHLLRAEVLLVAVGVDDEVLDRAIATTRDAGVDAVDRALPHRGLVVLVVDEPLHHDAEEAVLQLLGDGQGHEHLGWAGVCWRAGVGWRWRAARPFGNLQAKMVKAEEEKEEKEEERRTRRERRRSLTWMSSWMATQATGWQRRPRQVNYLMASGI